MKKSAILAVKSSVVDFLEERIESAKRRIEERKTELANMESENPDLDREEWSYSWRAEEIERTEYEIKLIKEIIEKI